MDGSGLVRQLKELSELHATGAISDAEFAAAKAAVLRGLPLGAGPSGAGPSGPPVADPAAAVPGPEPEGRPPTPAGPVRGGAPGPVPGNRFTGHGGAITAGAGGLIMLLAFLALPLATVPFLGSLTAADAAGLASQLGVLGLLWFVPLLAAAVVGIACWLLFGEPGDNRRTASISAMVMAGLVVLVYLVVLGSVQAEASGRGGSVPSFFGAGFWIAVLAAVAAGIGAAVEMAASRRGLE